MTIDVPMEEAELAEVSGRLESLAALEAAVGAVTWAGEVFGGSLAVASSFQDVVLVDIVRRHLSRAEIIFLDTGFHFAETLAFVEHTAKIWDLNLTVTRPNVGPDESKCGSPGCCRVRKVEPLQRALDGRACWITGLKRVDTPERESAPIIGLDRARSMVKVNPLATWSDQEIEGYLTKESLPRHPLTYAGYVSIGCEPTTKPVGDGQHPRQGRWPGSDKTECGLHI